MFGETAVLYNERNSIRLIPGQERYRCDINDAEVFRIPIALHDSYGGVRCVRLRLVPLTVFVNKVLCVVPCDDHISHLSVWY